MDTEYRDPSYYEAATRIYQTSAERWRVIDDEYKTPSLTWFKLMYEYSRVVKADIFLVICLALLWTALRSFMTNMVFKPIARISNLQMNEATKAPESAWKLLFYLTAWSYSAYILFATQYTFFNNPQNIFKNWDLYNEVPNVIYMCYMVQFSFYLHSVYATLYLDVWRKDSVLMMAHHFTTLLLIGFSYNYRYTNVGILVLFLHDITDIFLESAKLLVYYKSKGGNWEYICDKLATVGFACFAISWFVFRLYWFPLKALYAAGHLSIVNNPNKYLYFYHFFNGLLWILFAMNIWWFHLIVVAFYKIVKGGDVNDSREADNSSNQ